MLAELRTELAAMATNQQIQLRHLDRLAGCQGRDIRRLAEAFEQVVARLIRLERAETGERLLRRLARLEESLGLLETAPPRHTRRRPLGP